jgi:hypothetical protein
LSASGSLQFSEQTVRCVENRSTNRCPDGVMAHINRRTVDQSQTVVSACHSDSDSSSSEGAPLHQMCPASHIDYIPRTCSRIEDFEYTVGSHDVYFSICSNDRRFCTGIEPKSYVAPC